jgi:hypothetical protein
MPGHGEDGECSSNEEAEGYARQNPVDVQLGLWVAGLNHQPRVRHRKGGKNDCSESAWEANHHPSGGPDDVPEALYGPIQDCFTSVCLIAPCCHLNGAFRLINQIGAYQSGGR